MKIVSGIVKSVLVISGLLVLLTSGVFAQKSDCGSVRECADEMLRIANQFSRSVETLTKRVIGVEDTNNQLASRIGHLETRRSIVVYHCPKGTGGWNPGGAWGSYGCQGQYSSSRTCVNIEYPHRQERNCERIGEMTLK